MRRIACHLLAVISWLSPSSAHAAVRPRYGGTLHVQIQSPLTSLDPKQADLNPADATARRRILPLVFDTLVTVDPQGRAHPRLAIAWQADLSFHRWQLFLRPGVRFQDGTALSAELVVQSLSGSNSEWSARVEGEAVVIESDKAQPALLAELALLRNSVVRRGAAGEWVGTGPFRVVNWQPGKSLELAANDNCWASRPFLDSVQIDLGRNPRDQMLALQLDKADLIELGADQLSKASDAHTVRASLPVELLALVAGSNSKAEDAPLREALSAVIDRKAMQGALLRGGSEAAASVLPSWISGESFLFPIQVDRQHARQLMMGAKRTSPLILSYDSSDAVSRLIAERIALNAREVGIQVQAVAASGNTNNSDLRLTSILLPSPDPGVTLREVAATTGLSLQLNGSAAEDIYASEKKLLTGASVIPLFHIPIASAVGEHVRNWPDDKLGAWSLADVSLDRSGDPPRP